MSLRKFCFLFLSILASSLSFSQEVTFKEECAFHAIVENQNYCIKSVDEDKFYLDENNIYPTQEGLFLLVSKNGDYIHLPSLYSDNKGCYIRFSKGIFDPGHGIEVRSKCPDCGQRYIVICTNKDCPSYKRRKEK